MAMQTVRTLDDVRHQREQIIVKGECGSTKAPRHFPPTGYNTELAIEKSSATRASEHESCVETGRSSMPGRRKITGVKPLFGQSRSKAYNTVKRQFKPNLQNKRIYVPELDRWVRVKITAKELKTIDKIGFNEFLKRRNVSLKTLL